MLMTVLMIAGIASMVVLPMAVVALLGAVRKVARLEERNATQAQTISGLQLRLTQAGSPIGSGGDQIRSLGDNSWAGAIHIPQRAGIGSQGPISGDQHDYESFARRAARNLERMGMRSIDDPGR